MKNGKLILINGVSSSGKTTIAREIESLLSDFFYSSLDEFDLLIEKMENREAGKLIQAETEILYHRWLKSLIDCGVNVIVDHVLHTKIIKEDFLTIFSDVKIFKIGLSCSLLTLKEREKLRGDRRVGLAESQYNEIHQNITYDRILNTDENNLTENISRIMINLEENGFI